jgi:hypothetical protein
VLTGFYYVGPFANGHDAAEWGVENQGIDICWQPVLLDPAVPLELRAPGDMPELEPDPEEPDRWIEPPDGDGAFYLLLEMTSDGTYLVGPFPDHRHTYSWAMAYQARTDDGLVGGLAEGSDRAGTAANPGRRGGRGGQERCEVAAGAGRSRAIRQTPRPLRPH